MINDETTQTQEKLYDVWAKRNVHFEVGLEESVIRKIADYGNGATRYNTAKGYSLGAGYEVYILAFFLGLYANKRRPIAGEKKSFGQPIQYWGNIESRSDRKGYGKLREFIFLAAVARTDIDFMSLEKGELSVPIVIRSMIQTMDEYANYGLHLMLDKLEEDEYFFFNQTSFLSLFIPLFKTLNKENDREGKQDDDEPESLD